MDTLLTLPQIEKWFLLTLGIQMKLMQRIYQVILKFYSRHFLHIYAKDVKSKTRKLVRPTIDL